MEFITRGDRRRVWAVEQKRGIALESMDPSTTPTDVARRYGIASGLLYTWRRQMMEGQLGSVTQPAPGFARVDLVAETPRLAVSAPAHRDPDPQPPTSPTPPCASLIEIALPGGVVLRVPLTADPTHVARLVAALRGAAC